MVYFLLYTNEEFVGSCPIGVYTNMIKMNNDIDDFIENETQDVYNSMFVILKEDVEINKRFKNE